MYVKDISTISYLWNYDPHKYHRNIKDGESSYYLNYVLPFADSSTDLIFHFVSLWPWLLAYGPENS